MPSELASKTLPHANPEDWKKHRFGLSEERWKNLRDKSVWVTGAGSGFGQALSVALAAAGARVFLTGRRRAKLDESLQKMKLMGINPQNCRPIEADLKDFHKIKKICGEIIRSCGVLDGLVNNAALPSTGRDWPLTEDSVEEWENILRTNVTAPWFLTREILPSMGERARVIFVTSEAGWAFTPGYGPYNISKAALNNLSASLAEEATTRFPHKDIQINTIAPGVAKTEMNPHASESPYSIVSMALLLLTQPAGGPSGKFFHKDGRHLEFTTAARYEKLLS